MRNSENIYDSLFSWLLFIWLFFTLLSVPSLNLLTVGIFSVNISICPSEEAWLAFLRQPGFHALALCPSLALFSVRALFSTACISLAVFPTVISVRTLSPSSPPTTPASQMPQAPLLGDLQDRAIITARSTWKLVDRTLTPILFLRSSEALPCSVLELRIEFLTLRAQVWYPVWSWLLDWPSASAYA